MLCHYFNHSGKTTSGLDSDILEAPPKKLLAKSAASSDRQLRFGSVGGGLDLGRLALNPQDQVFSSQDNDFSFQLPHRPGTHEFRCRDRLGPNFLNQHPIDVLLIDDGDSSKSITPLNRWIASTDDANLPLVIAVAGPASRVSQQPDVTWRRARRKELEQRGYQAVEWLINSMDHGAALDQERTFDVYYQASSWATPAPSQPVPQGLPPRPMQNLLMPCGVPSSQWHKPKMPLQLEIPTTLPDQPTGPLCVGTCGKGQVLHPSGCMVDSLQDVWVATERGVRRLQAEELAKAKGLPSEWRNKDAPLSPKVVASATSLHSWVAVCDAIGDWCCPEHALDEDTFSTASTADLTLSDTEEEDCDWEAEYDYPDLAPGGEWHSARDKSLKQAIRGCPDADKLLQDGLDALEIHRQNYTEEGPKILQLLWWEFPPEHREAVRLGSSLCFLVDPGTELVPNPPLDGEELDVAAQFVDELMALGVLVPNTRPLRRVCPLFCVPKPGQPGQWRCIADMRRGGQNECCSHDPIYMSSHRDILPHLYTGGWSAVVDKSKYFHNFLTLPEEQDLLGVIHP